MRGRSSINPESINHEGHKGSQRKTESRLRASFVNERQRGGFVGSI